MSKKQIKITQDDLRKLVRESIQDKLNGVFSTDDPKAAEAVRNDFDPYDFYYGEDDSTRRSKETLANLIDKRANGEDAELDLPNRGFVRGGSAEMIRDAEPNKEESELYNKPFGDFDDTENQWESDPDLEEPEDEEEIYEGRQVRLKEGQLREFVSYSVSRLLREAFGRELMHNGDFDGYAESKYGQNSTIIEFDPMDDDDMEAAFESVLAEPEYAGKINPETLDNVWPIKVKVSFSNSREEGGDDGEWLENTEVDDWNIDMSRVPEEFKEIVFKVIENYFNGGYFSPNDMLSEEENKGILTHFGKKESEEAAKRYPNPYKKDGKFLPYDEYCEKKKEERMKDKEKEDKKEDKKPNKAITVHFSAKDLQEMTNACVRKLTEGMGMGDNEEPVTDNFPKKAAGTFTMNTRRGNTDKYKVYVEKTDNEELLTDIFVYDPMDKEWYPQAEYVVGIEEYTNGTWLPYWETFNGDVSIRALANCFGKVVKLWKKVGYLFDEDNEIPFRYAGDIKGLNGKRY